VSSSSENPVLIMNFDRILSQFFLEDDEWRGPFFTDFTASSGKVVEVSATSTSTIWERQGDDWREEKKKHHTNRSKSPERHQREERASEISPPAAERSLKYPPPVRPVVSRTHQPYRSDKGRLDPEEKRRKIIPTVVGGPERGQQEASRSAQWRSAASWISFSSISRKITTLPWVARTTLGEPGHWNIPGRWQIRPDLEVRWVEWSKEIRKSEPGCWRWSGSSTKMKIDINKFANPLCTDCFFSLWWTGGTCWIPLATRALEDLIY